MSTSASLFILQWNRPIAPMYTDLQSVWEIQACHYSVREFSSFVSSRVIPIVLTGSGNINLYNMGYNYNNGGWSEWSLWLCAPRTEYWRFYRDWSNLVVSLGHLIPVLHLTYAGNRGELSTFYTYFCATSHGYLKCTCNTTLENNRTDSRATSVAVRVVLGLSAGIPLSVLTCRAFRGFITLSGLSFVFGVEIVEILRGKCVVSNRSNGI